ncbi:hypothetical protein [Klebsiella aerogenes]|uniref:hypothetical protein n=1 Tax=Klebsiella aerogenes TaxID=548 RepID=UPI003A80C927
MNIDTVSELIQSLESAGELSIKERKYLELAKAYADKEAESVAQALTFEKCRELSGCPAGVDLQDWVKQLAAESLVLKDINAWCKTDAFKNMYREFKAAEALGCSDVDCMHDAMLVAIMHAPETPATDRIVAGIKADGVEEFAKYISLYSSNSEQHAINFAKQLREGADK